MPSHPIRATLAFLRNAWWFIYLNFVDTRIRQWFRKRMTQEELNAVQGTGVTAEGHLDNTRRAIRIVRRRFERGTKIRDAALFESVFLDCDLRFCVITGSNAMLNHASFAYSRLDGTILNAPDFLVGTITMSRCDLSGVTGLYGEQAAFSNGRLTETATKPCRYQRWGSGKWWGDNLKWETVKLLGELPLFGLSNLALFGILAYAAVAQSWNDQADAFRTWAATQEHPEVLHAAVEQLRNAPRPADEVKVELKRGARKQLFSLNNPADSIMRWDITDEVRLGDDGHPTFESLDLAADTVFDDIVDLLD